MFYPCFYYVISILYFFFSICVYMRSYRKNKTFFLAFKTWPYYFGIKSR